MSRVGHHARKVRVRIVQKLGAGVLLPDRVFHHDVVAASSEQEHSLAETTNVKSWLNFDIFETFDKKMGKKSLLVSSQSSKHSTFEFQSKQVLTSQSAAAAIKNRSTWKLLGRINLFSFSRAKFETRGWFQILRLAGTRGQVWTLWRFLNYSGLTSLLIIVFHEPRTLLGDTQVKIISRTTCLMFI